MNRKCYKQTISIIYLVKCNPFKKLNLSERLHYIYRTVEERLQRYHSDVAVVMMCLALLVRLVQRSSHLQRQTVN